MRVRRQVARDIFRGVCAMQESDTYLAILDEGREAQMKKILVQFGRERFGPPDEAITARLNAITDNVERLERLIERFIQGTATSWQDLLDTP
jgi:hypothetical protein